MELPGKRKQRRPKRRSMDVVREDMTVVEVTEEDAEDRIKWHGKSAVATTDGRSEKKTRKEVHYLYWLHSG